MTKDEAFKEYEETMNKLDFASQRARDEAKGKLNIQLQAIRATLHNELKAVRAIQQKKGR